jgi:hypothetical protein
MHRDARSKMTRVQANSSICVDCNGCIFQLAHSRHKDFHITKKNDENPLFPANHPFDCDYDGASGSVGGSSSQNSTNVKAMLGNPKQSDICLSQGYKETRFEQASNACDPVSPSSTVLPYFRYAGVLPRPSHTCT